MSNLELQNWANRIDIWKDKKSDSDFIDIKNKLVKDMENLWNLKLQWKITQEEYSRYWMKFREILEKNFTSKKEVQKRYEETRKEIMEETKSKTKLEQKGLLEKIGFSKKEEKETVSQEMLKIISKPKNDLLKDVEKLIDNWRLDLLRKYLLTDTQKRVEFLAKFNNNHCPFTSVKYYSAFDKIMKEVQLKQLEKIKKVLVKRLWKKEWEKETLKIFELINKKSCTFDLIKYFNNLNKTLPKNKRITNSDMKSVSENTASEKIKLEEVRLNEILNKYKISIKEINWKKSEEILKILKNKGLNQDEQTMVLHRFWQWKGAKIMQIRVKNMTNKDFKKASELINKWIDQKEIMKILEKQNEKLAQLNNKIKKEEDPLYNPKNDKKLEQSKKSNPIEQKLSSQISNSSVIKISSNFWWIGRKEYFKIILESVEKTWEKQVKNKAWLNFKLSKDWSGYKINYGWIEHGWLKWEEIPKAISFGNFTAKLGLDFLLPFSSKILQKINSKELLVNDGDWLKRDEKNIIMNKIGKVIFWKDYNPTNDNKKNREQFKTQKSKNVIEHFNLALQKNPSSINNFLNKIV